MSERINWKGIYVYPETKTRARIMCARYNMSYNSLLTALMDAAEEKENKNE